MAIAANKRRITVTIDEETYGRLVKIAEDMEITPAAAAATVVEASAGDHQKLVRLMKASGVVDLVRHYQRYAARKSETPQQAATC